MPSRTDWLLRFIIGVTPHYDGWIDRIRVMKGLFLFQKEGGVLPGELNYTFRPYDYGPFTAEVYRDADMLISLGFVTDTDEGKSYRATKRGVEYASEIAFPEQPLERLREIRVEVSDYSFRELLRRVYEAYPESASRSVAKDVLR